jgi:uncharacterized protein (DUF302 family)
MKRLIILLAMLMAFSTARAEGDELLMVRSSLDFPEAMAALQEAVTEHGYTISRVQRVDIGLTAMGYKTDKYRVVFVGKHEQQVMIIRKHPELIPYLPIKIAIFAEGDDTILTAANPVLLGEFFPDPSLEKYFRRCESDMRSIMAQVQEAE